MSREDVEIPGANPIQIIAFDLLAASHHNRDRLF
jgi:hypothetical protein